LQEWQGERGVSVEWLRSIGQADWKRAHEHAYLGPLRGGDLLLSWVNHDHLHLRQLVQRLYQFSSRAGVPYSCDYAGPW